MCKNNNNNKKQIGLCFKDLQQTIDKKNKELDAKTKELKELSPQAQRCEFSLINNPLEETNKSTKVCA